MIKAMRLLVMFVLAILVIVDVALSARAVVDSTAGLVVAVAAANDDDSEQQLRQQPTSETRPPTTTLATIGPSEPPSQFVYLTSLSSYSGPTVVATPSIVTTAEANATTAEAADEQQQQTTTTTTTTTMTHRLGPTDDTYIEIYRPNTPLGDRTKLKLDAIDTDEEEWDDGKDETRRKRRNGRMPTKVILLKFDINRVMKRLPVANDNNSSNHRTLRVINGNEEEVTTTTTLARVTLNMYALTESKFGGYVTRLRTNLHRDDNDDNNNDYNDWDEESTTWRDLVNGDNNNERDDVENRAKRLLPDDDKPRGKWILAASSSQSRNNNNTTTTNEGEEEWIRLPKNPEIGHFNTVTANEWSSIDITDTIYQMPLMSDDDNLAVVHLDNNNTSSSSSRSSTSDDDDSRVLSLMITTDIVDGVIYASKEDWSSNGPYLEFTFTTTTTTTTTTVMTTTDSSTPTTMTVNSSLITSSVMTPVIMGNNHKEATALTEIVNTTTTTSVISSSFRMTLIAIETRDNAIPGSSSTSRNNTVDVVPSLEEKEGSSIIEHLLRVYREVLSIPPIDISLAFEEELVVEDVVLGDESSSSSGVIRKCVFRVMALFDQFVLKNMTSEEVEVLDAATNYAFLGPEGLEFINVYKSTGPPIVTDPANYDVTVLQGDYLAAPTTTATAAVDDLNDSSVMMMDNADILSSTPTSNPTWIKPTFIAGSSVIAFASMAAALLLWKQRRGDAYVGDGNSRKSSSFVAAGDSSPRSLDSTTVPNTPSPTSVFMDRFNMKKTKFDYAEFDDEEDAEDPSIYATDRIDDAIVINPSTIVECQQFTTNNVVGLKPDYQPTLNIEYTERGGNASDSSVSDVSAHLLGASRMRNDSGAESLLLDTTVERLLDTTVESYNMEVMSALDQVRFEDVLASSPAANYNYTSYNARYASDDDNNCSLSTGAVPSEMYSNLSMDYSDTSRVAAHGGHLFALDPLRNKDSSLLEMPPPPSDIASDSESQQDVGEEDGEAGVIPSCDNELASDMTRGKIGQDVATQDINDEWTKIMKLLNNSSDSEGHSHYIGTVAGHNLESKTWETNDTANAKYDGLSVIIQDELEPVSNKFDTRNSADEEDESSLDAERVIVQEEFEGAMPCETDTRNFADENDESSLVTEQI